MAWRISHVGVWCGALLALAVTGDAGERARPTPKRIIATAPSNAEIVCALGAGNRLVGVSPYVTYPPEIADLPKVGGIHDPDLEAVLRLRPDLVISRGQNTHLENLCRQSHIDLYQDRTDSLASLHETIRELGEVLACQESATALNASLDKRLNEIRRASMGRKRPKVLFTLRSPDRLASITTVAGDSYLASVLQLAGGENIFGELEVAYPQVSLEEILARQPEVIIEAMPGEELSPKQTEELRSQWRELGSIPAVREKRIHVLTEDYVLIPSPRVVLLAERLQTLLAPHE